MAKLVFDIETIAQPMEQFDPVQREYLFREAENLPDPAERDARRLEIQRQFSLWPLTGHVVCIAMINADSFRGKVPLPGGGLRRSSEPRGGLGGICALRRRSGNAD